MSTRCLKYLLVKKGLKNGNIQYFIRFTLRSPYTIVYMISLFGQFLMFVMSFYWLMERGVSLSNFTNSLFYTSSLISSLVLMKIFKSWPKMMIKVEAIESSLPPLPRKVTKVCNATMAFILTAAVVEHFLSIFYGCTVAYSCGSKDVVETFFHFNMPWIFEYTTYNLWKGILIEIFNIQSTFIWSFSDILIMVISIYLTEHIISSNTLLKKALKQDHFSASEFRMQYLKVVDLVRLMNEQIGIYVLISFGSNLYWICTQLFYCLNKAKTGHFIACHDENSNSKLNGIEHSVYFTFSLSFIVLRTLMVLFLAARIHTNSKEPLVYLYGLHNEKFDNEVERFIAQIINIKVALSGLDFFYVTRTMILTLMGTIITYELVLLQFNK